MGYIYWIASYPKSGNTWMRAFLAAVVTGAERLDLDALRQIAPDENMGRYYQMFMTKPIEQASLEEIARARPMAHRAIAAGAKGFLFLKTHSMLARHLGAPTITADVTAGAIHIVRNPLDVAVSYSEFRNRDVSATIELMNQQRRVLDRPRLGAYEVCGSWAEHVRSWTDKAHDRLLVIRYEDMLAEPQKTFGDVVSFLRMDADASQVQRAIERTSFEALQQAEETAGFGERPPETKRFFRAGRSDQWRQVLTEEQVARIATTCEREMRRFGYWLPEFDDLVKAADIEEPRHGQG
ncbi:MAG: hypothetical protein JWQ89_3296 [Devosia sp.]|uniref:sulfotransferase domain-containing protein n=1 Tax=Devosia sp. TaxID=1871048 RepID=UPI00262FEC81|nr:sulfotransferase domain-containing protein [Devosia sp.]MDB5541569.1 hypothetical protein [Devosia sp.]